MTGSRTLHLFLALLLGCASSAPPPPPSPGATLTATAAAGASATTTDTTAALRGAPPPAPTADAALGARVDAALDAALAEQRIVGAVVLVLRDGKLVHHRAAGLFDREANRPLSEDALFRYASVTKPFVATAALALVDRGKLSLEDPVTRWLPGFEPRLKSGQAPVITVRHLLTHTGGLGYTFLEKAGGPYHRARVSDGSDQPGLSFAENARRIVSVPLLSAPGTAFHYSVSTDVLGEVVAKAAGTTLPEAVAELVTRPLGLASAGFQVHDPERLAVPYYDGEPAPVRMAAVQPVSLWGGAVAFAPGRVLDPQSYPSGGAGMVGTAAEIGALLEALRTGGAGILKPETVAAAMSNQIGELRAPEIGGAGWGFGYLGGVVVSPAEAEVPMSPGTVRWGGAYGHMWFVDPVEALTVVLLTNTAFEGMIGKITTDLTAAVYGR